jgi:hypothetical protein
MNSLPNTVLPSKLYTIWGDDRELGEVMADNVHEAFAEGRRLWGNVAMAAFLKGKTAREPMFL